MLREIRGFIGGESIIDLLAWSDTGELIGYESKFSAQLTLGILFYSVFVSENDIVYLRFIAIV